MSRRRSLCVLMAALVAVSQRDVLAGDLLEQAVEDRGSAAGDPVVDVSELIDQGDELAAQERFNEAIELYSKAFRLSPDDPSNYMRLLAAKRAAGRLTAEEREALNLIEEQQAEDVRQAFRLTRLGLLQTRQALRDGDTKLARTRLAAARTALKALPADVDDSVYRQEIAAVQRQLDRAESRIGRPAKADGTPAGVSSEMQQPADADSPEDIQPSEFGDAAASRADSGVPPVHDSGEIVDVDSLLDRDRQQYAYEREMADALRRNRAEWVFQIDEASHAALEDMTFPADWEERTAKRRSSRDGVIHEGKPFEGPDGETYVTAIYDLGDLVHPIPNFAATYPGTAGEQQQQLLDREALRMRSMIFGGYAEDLAAGLPLLPFFGGVDTNAVSRRCDPHETDRVIETIEAFLNR